MFQIDKINNIETYGMAVLIGVILVFVVSHWNWFKMIYLAFSLPGPPALPLIGNAHLATNNTILVNLGNTLYQKYGRLVRVWIAVIPTFIIIEPQDLQNVLGTYKNTDKTFLYSLMHNFLGEGLITSSGDRWKFHRRLMHPIFHIHILDSFVETFSSSSKMLIDNLNKVTQHEEDINVTLLINNSVLDILNEAVLGIPVNEKSQYFNDKNSPFRQGKVVTQTRIRKPWLLLNCIYNLTKNAKEEIDQKQNLNLFTKKILEQKIRISQNGIKESKKKCLMEMLIEIRTKNPEFNENDIISEVCTLMLAGQDSVSSGIAFCMYFLATHQDIQERVYKELNTIFKSSKDMPNMQNLRDMKYLEQCIKESLRLCPSVPLIARKLGEDITIGKHILPVGSNVLVSPFVTHRLPHIYPDPQKYDPDRFTNEQTEMRHPFAFLPFSGGPRNCIGYKFAMLEMKTVISTILRHYHLSVSPGYELNISFRITLRAKHGVWLRIKPRI